MTRIGLIIAVLAHAAATLGADIELPRTLAWSAYNLGTTGYNQAVAIGKVMKDEYGTSLRVIPGKNDISRLLPLRRGRVQFAANGIATFFAQEGVFQFAQESWGPLPLRLVMTSNGPVNQALAVATDSGVTMPSELRGKRIPWVRGAPSLNVNTEAFLRCGGLTWDDVERIDFPGYNAMWTGIVNDQIDAAFATTVSGPTRKLEASPRGITWLPAPHDDEACWNAILDIAPHFTRHRATRGAAISEANPHEGGTYPYPLLTVMASQDADLVRNVVRVIVEHYDAFKDADPGAVGWAIDRQVFDWVVPFHEAAVAYFAERGVWSAEHDAHNRRLIERQAVLAEAWERTRGHGEQAWMTARRAALTEAGFDPYW